MKASKVLLVVCLGLLSSSSFATEYGEPDTHEYYNTLMQPDNSKVSCCGEGDVYHADQVDNCNLNNEFEKNNCALVAIITDKRPNKIELPNGGTIYRDPIQIGTRIPIPSYKIRKHPIANPTEHNIIFVKNNGMGSYNVYCWEPVSGL